MPIGRAWIGCAALYLAALTARPALAAPRWLCAQSPHFELYSSSDRDSVARLGGALETMAEILGEAGLGRRTAARPVTVIIGFPDKNSFTPHLPVIDGRRASFAGYVIHNPYGNWIGYGEYDERGRMVAQHEYVHTIVNQVFRHLPLTLNEGFADYLSTFRAEPSLAEFGHPIPWYRAAIQEMSLRPLDEMFEIDAAALHKLSGDEQSLFYAESWAFVHYLLRADATGGRFTQFMRAAAEGGPIRSAFARYYPDETWDKIPPGSRATWRPMCSRSTRSRSGSWRVPPSTSARRATQRCRPRSGSGGCSKRAWTQRSRARSSSRRSLRAPPTGWPVQGSASSHASWIVRKRRSVTSVTSPATRALRRGR